MIIRNISNGILRNKEIENKRKYQVYERMIKSTLLYGKEIRKLTEEKNRKIEAVEMNAITRSVGLGQI